MAQANPTPNDNEAMHSQVPATNFKDQVDSVQIGKISSFPNVVWRLFSVPSLQEFNQHEGQEEGNDDTVGARDRTALAILPADLSAMLHLQLLLGQPPLLKLW